jgi:DNA-binding response OmpR family regulator
MAGADTRTLLLVEDDQALLAMLERLLSDEGYAVTVASDGQRGLHLGLTRPFDVMVIDRGLPAIEGVDLLGRLRSRSVGSPALILTARGTLADRVEGLDAGAQDYLVKPFEIDELLARLRASRHDPSSGSHCRDTDLGSVTNREWSITLRHAAGPHSGYRRGGGRRVAVRPEVAARTVTVCIGSGYKQ